MVFEGCEMSTSWYVVCRNCKLNHYLGQRFTSISCFGYGSKDEEGRNRVASFIEEHLGDGESDMIIINEHDLVTLKNTKEISYDEVKK